MTGTDQEPKVSEPQRYRLHDHCPDCGAVGSVYENDMQIARARYKCGRRDVIDVGCGMGRVEAKCPESPLPESVMVAIAESRESFRTGNYESFDSIEGAIAYLQGRGREPKLSPRYCEACKTIRPIAPCDDPDNCPMDPHGNRPGPESDLSPVVTRNAMSPDELWAMQEKPHVSDDAPDMGPIPGTEGIESDPPESPLHELPADWRERYVDTREGWHNALGDMLKKLISQTAATGKAEAERDALKAALHELCGDVLATGDELQLTPGAWYGVPDGDTVIGRAQRVLGCEGWCQPDSHWREARILRGENDA